VWPSPRPDIMGTATPAAGHHRREKERHLSPTPPSSACHPGKRRIRRTESIARGEHRVSEGSQLLSGQASPKRRPSEGRPSGSRDAVGGYTPRSAPTTGSPRGRGRPRLCSMSGGITIPAYLRPGLSVLKLVLVMSGAGFRRSPFRRQRRPVHDHVGMGIAAVQAHDVRTGFAHFEAALALDSTSYEATGARPLPSWMRASDSRQREKPAPRLALLPRGNVGEASRGSGLRAREANFALAAAIGRASLTMGKKERIRRAAVIRDEALRTIAIDPRHDGAYQSWPVNGRSCRLSGSADSSRRGFSRGNIRQGVVGRCDLQHGEGRRAGSGANLHRLDLAVIYATEALRRRETRLDKVAELPTASHGSGVPPTGGRSRGETRRSGIAYRLLVECVSRLVGGSIDPASSLRRRPTALCAACVARFPARPGRLPPRP